MPTVFMWMFIGLLITFSSGFIVSEHPEMLSSIFDSNLYWIFIVAEVIIAMVLSFKIATMNKHVAICLYILYTLLTGLNISFIFIAYELPSIMIIFLITSVLFGIFALIGKYTKIDLSKLWVFLLIGFVGIIILEIVNVFLLSNSLSIFTCILGLVVFLGYTAYDIQRISRSYELDDVDNSSYPILFAFNLFIDFINIFLDLLRLFGDTKD